MPRGRNSQSDDPREEHGAAGVGILFDRAIMGAPFRRVHALRAWFFRAPPRRGGSETRTRVARRGEAEKTEASRGGKKGERETHVRATTMYFGAALHTPRGGQCPSLLRPKEREGGRVGGKRGRKRRQREGAPRSWRERGNGSERGRNAEWRAEGAHKRGVEKNEQTSSERDGDREERPGARSLLSSRILLSFLFHFSLAGRHSFSSYPSPSLYDAPRRLQRWASYSPSDSLNVKSAAAKRLPPPRLLYFRAYLSLPPRLSLSYQSMRFLFRDHVYSKDHL